MILWFKNLIFFKNIWIIMTIYTYYIMILQFKFFKNMWIYDDLLYTILWNYVFFLNMWIYDDLL